VQHCSGHSLMKALVNSVPSDPCRRQPVFQGVAVPHAAHDPFHPSGPLHSFHAPPMMHLLPCHAMPARASPCLRLQEVNLLKHVLQQDAQFDAPISFTWVRMKL